MTIATLIALAACQPTAAPTNHDDTDPTVESPPDSDAAGGPVDTDDTDLDVPTDPNAACAPDHALLDLEPRVVEARRVDEWAYPKWQLDLWLNLNGLGWIAPTSFDVTTWRVRYTTQDRGVATEATALVAIPSVGSVTSMGTVLWLHGTTGFEEACAPSIGAVEGVAPAIISAGRGQIAVAPDYLGLPAFGTPDPSPHPWIIGEPSGIVALDALRAVADWLPTSGEKARIDKDKIVYWGWSEGGYTALMADRWAPHYAPDFAPRGVIAAIPPVDLVGQVREGLETFAPATGAAAVMLTLAAEWYGVDGLDAVLQPDVLADLPGELAEQCADFPSVVSATATTDLFLPTFINAMTTETGVEPWTCLLERSSVGSETVPYASDAPVLLITGEGDHLVPEGPVRAAIPTLCDQGYAIEHRSCDDLDHSDAATRTLREQIRWLDARMDGTPAGSACGATAPVTCGG